MGGYWKAYSMLNGISKWFVIQKKPCRDLENRVSLGTRIKLDAMASYGIPTSDFPTLPGRPNLPEHNPKPMKHSQSYSEGCG